MQVGRKKAIKYKKPIKGFHTATLLFSIIAVTLISIGLYLELQNKSAIGISQPGRYGQPAGTVHYVPGLFVIVLGGFFASFPIIDLLQYLKKWVTWGIKYFFKM